MVRVGLLADVETSLEKVSSRGHGGHWEAEKTQSREEKETHRDQGKTKGERAWGRNNVGFI